MQDVIIQIRKFNFKFAPSFLGLINLGYTIISNHPKKDFNFEDLQIFEEALLHFIAEREDLLLDKLIENHNKS